MTNERKEYLTKEKYEELKRELHYLTTIKRKEIAQAISDAKSIGDLSENAEYHDARNAQAELEEKIKRIEDTLQDALIIEKRKAEMIGIGSIVKLKRTDEEDVKEYQIVGSAEADLSNGKLSINSPLGSMMIGKRDGEKVVLQAPNGKKKTYEIIEVQ